MSIEVAEKVETGANEAEEKTNGKVECIYLKFKRPEGKSFYFIDMANMKRMKKEPVVLFNDSPPSRALTETEMNHLLKQDPRLVGTEMPDFSKDFATEEDRLKFEKNELHDEIGVLKKEIKALKTEMENGDTTQQALKDTTEELKIVRADNLKLVEENKILTSDKTGLNEEIIGIRQKLKKCEDDK